MHGLRELTGRRSKLIDRRPPNLTSFVGGQRPAAQDPRRSCALTSSILSTLRTATLPPGAGCWPLIPRWTSPYPYAGLRAASRQRADTLVAVWRNADGSAAGFLPVQRTGAHTAMPVGGPGVRLSRRSSGRRRSIFRLAAKGDGCLDGSISRRGSGDNTVSSCLMAGDAGVCPRFADGWLRRSIGPPGLFSCHQAGPPAKKG